MQDIGMQNIGIQDIGSAGGRRARVRTLAHFASSRCAYWAALLAVMTASGVAAQDATSTAEPGTVVVYGEVAEPVRFTAAGLAAMERRTVTGTDHAGSGRVTYEGVPLRALLDRAGVAGDVDLRGEELLRWVVVEAADGYRVLFSLAELDPLYESAAPILADRRDGAPLPDDVGPFQIIAPEETRHARWVRQVRCLRVGRVR